MYRSVPTTASFVVLSLAAFLVFLPATSHVLAQEPVSPLEMPEDIDAAKADLGRKLFFDPRLSRSGFLSCNSCHNLSMGGTDNLVSSIGHGWQEGPINSPTVLNAVYNIAQFWDGRAADLQEQAAGPIANPKEMALPHDIALAVVASIPEYVAEFEQAYGDETVNIERVTDVLAEFERTLVTPDSPFDQWLRGDKNAISDSALAGYELFKTSGCLACHNGPALGGTSFQKFGLVNPHKTDNPAQGRYDVTGKESDRMVFKVPTLRNIALTYPYFHDGSAATLADAINEMGVTQLGRKFTGEETQNMVAFLGTLTGRQPSFALPILPPSTASTPPPQPFLR
ncbi:MAG: cytochrome-c peroxidase [Halieaceae bacterium]|jgi:cytochrome c peroxidase|nr:cytochrome-c peroxidase [Halieaceae bacterium]